MGHFLLPKEVQEADLTMYVVDLVFGRVDVLSPYV